MCEQFNSFIQCLSTAVEMKTSQLTYYCTHKSDVFQNFIVWFRLWGWHYILPGGTFHKLKNVNIAAIDHYSLNSAEN